MITKIHYKNFKALRNATLPLGRFTLLVGANGTGKSTAINGFKILTNPKSAEWEKIASIGLKYESVKISVFIDDFQNIPFLSEQWNENGYVDTRKDEDSLDKALYKATFDVLTFDISSFRIFGFDPEIISRPVTIDANLELDENGKNLAGVLDQLRDTDNRKFEELNTELQKWLPEYDRISFETPDKGVKSFVLITKIGKYKIKAADLSDGTRLALAYLTIAYLPNPPKIVCFEEPERGIHPRLLRNIQEAMDRLAYPENFGEKREPVQVIATTHSPYLLDLYKDRREEIVIADKDEKGVHFNRLIDLPHIEEILKEQDAPLGDVWFSGILGGVPA
jgi:predicted ATPase